uniref:EamA domain-containing protein n=1 Tax=Craspedostauros australis TaxID=1486917 RepID=A0A7R9WU89_9STRA
MKASKILFGIVLFLSAGSGAFAWASAAATSAVVLKDYSGAAAGLFNNMRTPAALIAGSIVPLGLLGSVPVVEGDDSRTRLLKRGNILVAIASVLSEIIAITYSTIAINKLAEIQYPATASVVELVINHHELAWIGTNIHFLGGMLGFGLLVGNKAFLNFGHRVGKVAACWGVAAFLQCLSIVNRGIAMGSGTLEETSARIASNLFTLTTRYIFLVLKKADGVLSIASIGIFGMSLVLLAKLLLTNPESATPKNKTA